VDAAGNDGNASMPEQGKRPNPWRKTMMLMMMMINLLAPELFFFNLAHPVYKM